MFYRVELIICKSNNTWFLDTVEISHEEMRGQEDFDCYAENYAIEKWKDNYAKHAKKIEDITYIGVYSIKELKDGIWDGIDQFDYKEDKKDYNDVADKIKNKGNLDG